MLKLNEYYDGIKDIYLMDLKNSLNKKFLNEYLGMLTERERYVINKYYLSNRNNTYESIGNETGVSRERVRQIIAKALKKLRRYAIKIPLFSEIRELYMDLKFR